MMQNRSNRNLLFGGRADAASTAAAPAPASSSELDAMEADNQGGVDALRGSAGMMKDVSAALLRDAARDVMRANTDAIPHAARDAY